MNLHKITRGLISAVARDKPCQLYTATGEQSRSERGDTLPVYLSPRSVLCQFQSVSAETLSHLEKINVTTATRRVYIHADYDARLRPWAQYRPLGRSGDVLVDDLDQQWLITDVLEDYSHVGWVSVLAVMQTPPLRILEKPR